MRLKEWVICVKGFKTLDQQVEYLGQNKRVVVPSRIKAKKDLYDGNYYNIISCSKIKFAESITDNRHHYSEREFKEWLGYFKLDCVTSEYLMKNMLNFERKINSRVAYRISELLETGQLKNKARKQAVKWISDTNRQSECVRYITEIFECSDKFIAIKNSQHKVD